MLLSLDRFVFSSGAVCVERNNLPGACFLKDL